MQCNNNKIMYCRENTHVVPGYPYINEKKKNYALTEGLIGCFDLTIP